VIGRRIKGRAGKVVIGCVLAAMAAAIGVSGVAAASSPRACRATQLSARIVNWEGAAGSRIANIELVNTSFSACTIRNNPRVRMVSGHGATLLNGPAASTTGATHILAGLGFLKAEAGASNYCGHPYAKPVTLQFVLPGTLGSVLAIPVSPTDVSGVPPCNGAPGSAGDISMHAWHT
jgi:uncharacterized protein DUF4232